MGKSNQAEAWVVYQVILRGKGAHADEVRNAVCEQSEWDALERAQPGQLALVRGHIRNEAEAELLARGTSGDPKVRLPRRS